MTSPVAAELLDASAVEQPPGVEWCRTWTSRVDAALALLLGDRRGIAVVALGGYARRELCPASDIDLLVLHSGWGREDLEGAVQTLCYPLWDAGLSVGHAVRTPAESIASAGERIDTATALFDRRLVAGDPGLFDALASRVDRWARKQRKRLISALAEADRERHEQAGRDPGRLEPELKNGAGGLRDLHSLRWAGGWAVGEATLDALVSAGYMGATDRRSLAAANDTLLKVRCALHLARPNARGRDVDQLRLELQDEVAAAVGLHTEDGAGDGDALLRQVGLAARTVAHVHGRTWPLLLADVRGLRRRRRIKGVEVAPGVALEDGLVAPTEGADGSDPAWALRAVAVAAQHDAHLTRRAAVTVAEQMAREAPLPWTPESREALLMILGSGPGAVDALLLADHLGILSAYLPDWERIRGRPQRNPLHRYDLDTHAARAVAALHRLVDTEPALRALWDRIEDRETVLLAVWLHDLGKAWPGDHSEVGADVARRWLADMGFDAELGERVAHLVRWHLLLPDAATRRDLDDELEIETVATIIGDVAALDALYLLSLADGRATGPAAWSGWKDSLMARLHAAVRAHLGAPLPTPPLHDRQVVTASDEHRRLVRAHAPARYFEIADDEQVTAHAELLAAGPPGELRVSLRAGSVPGTTVLSLVARDRLGLVADCAGVLAANDLDVVEARAITGPEGLALDWFTINGGVDAERITDDLGAVATGERTVEQLLKRRRRTPAAVSPGDSAITLRDYSTIEVRAPDTPGLLWRLCRVLADHHLNVRTARISSLGSSVFDVFEVTPAVVPTAAVALKKALLSASNATT